MPPNGIVKTPMARGAEKPNTPRYARNRKLDKRPFAMQVMTVRTANARYETRKRSDGKNLGCMKIRRENHDKIDSGHSRAGRGAWSSSVSFSSLRRSIASITVHRAISRRFRSENSCRKSSSSILYSASWSSNF